MYDTCRYLRAIEHHLISSSIVYAPVSMMATMERKPSPSGSRSSKRSQRASFFPLKIPMVGSNEINKKPIFRGFLRSVSGSFFFSCLKPHTLAEEHLFCNTFPVPSLGAFWFINFKPCRIFLVSFLDVCFGSNETNGSKNGAVPNNNGEILESTDHHAKITLFGVQNNQNTKYVLYIWGIRISRKLYSFRQTHTHTYVIRTDIFTKLEMFCLLYFSQLTHQKFPAFLLRPIAR